MGWGGFLIIAASAGLASAEGPSLTSKNLEPLRECLAGIQSDVDQKTTARAETRFRGNMFLLNQRKPDALACATPRNDVIAWARPSGSASSEMTFVYPNASGQLVVHRYEVKNREMASNRYIELPDSSFNCNKLAEYVSPTLAAAAPHESVRVSMGSFPAEFTSERKKDWKLGEPPRLYDLASIPKDSERTVPYGGEAKDVPLPTSDVLVEEMLSQLAHHWTHMEDRALAVVDPPSRIFSENMKRVIGKCEEAQKALAAAATTPAARKAADAAAEALADARSVYISPDPSGKRRTMTTISDELAKESWGSK